MGSLLIVTGKVQVDIRLLIPFKSKESLEGNIMTILIQFMPTDRTVLIRHITAAGFFHGISFYGFRFKIGIFAIGTDIMRRQRVYLCDTCHILSLLDALVPAGLLVIAAARLGEHFSDFGWGQTFESARWQFFPIAVQDMFGQWHFAVYVLEALLALLVCAACLRVSRGMPGDRFLTALLWWSASQIFCESLRAETIRWGFVRVQQLQCAVFILCVLIAFAVKAGRRGEKKRILPAAIAFVLGIGTVVLMEYAIDKWDLSIAVCYAIMASALLAMAAMVQRVRPRLLPED